MPALPHEDWVRIRGLELDCVVGVYPHERDVPQPLGVDLDLCLDTDRAGRRERLRFGIDYAGAAAQVRFLLSSCRFRMLETAAHAVLRLLLAPPGAGERRAQVVRARIVLSKPGALGGRAVPSIEVERDAAWASVTQEQRPFGVVDVIHETRDAGIYRLNLAPGAEIPLHLHREMEESEMVLSRGLYCQKRPVAAGTVHRWPKGAAHCYANRSKRWQTILCVDVPRFIEADEVVVAGEPAHVQPEA